MCYYRRDLGLILLVRERGRGERGRDGWGHDSWERVIIFILYNIIIFILSRDGIPPDVTSLRGVKCKLIN